MIEISIISSRERRLGFFLSLALGLTLATTLLPGIHSLYLNLLRFLPLTSPAASKLLEMSLFGFVAGLFFLSIPKKARLPDCGLETIRSLLPSFILPVLIALIFGCVLRNQFFVSSQNRIQDLFWFSICIPIGEELLFRGWLWAIFRSLFKKRFFTLTNPLPAELVFTSISFSVWHLQNYSEVSVPFLTFQLLYTFVTGLWLGYLRWRTGNISSSALAHTLINLAASLPTLL